MSILFTPQNIGNVTLKNRFISSACEDNLPSETGDVNEQVLKKYETAAKGGAGLIISGHMAVHPQGRARKKQIIIYDESKVAGLKKLADSVHKHDCKIVFQIGHAGVQSSDDAIGCRPSGPSTEPPLDEDSISEIIGSFSKAARIASIAGADGVQIHAAHGYLVNEFLSPYYNRRTDEWGGSYENRFRLLREIIRSVKNVLQQNMALMIKLNANDYTPTEGITTPLAVEYASMIAKTGIDAIEVSCGTSLTSPWNMCRGELPVNEIVQKFPEEQRANIREILQKKSADFTHYEGYNVGAANEIKAVAGDIHVIPVGGWRKLATMENAVNSGVTEFISLCRPLIREPNLVKNFQSGRSAASLCSNCNRCLIAIGNGLPVRCYVKGF